MSANNLLFSGTGKIGIGTTAPSNALHVNATSNPLRLQGLATGSTSTDKLVVADATGVIKEIGTLDVALATISVPKPSLFELQTGMTNFLSTQGAGGSEVVPMALIKNAITGLTYDATTRTITFPAGTYQITFVYEATHDNGSCNLSSYFIDFPTASATRRIHSTAAHNNGGASNHGGTITFTTQLPAGKTWQIRLGRGQSGNCTGTGMVLGDTNTQLTVFRIGD
jgi:hypothetical protein